MAKQQNTPPAKPEVLVLIDALEVDAAIKEKLTAAATAVLDQSQTAADDKAKAEADLATATTLNETLQLSVDTLTESNAAQEEELVKLRKENMIATKRVPGTYKSKETKKEYRFKEGHLKIRLRGKLVETQELIDDKEAMEELIKMGAGVIEEVPAGEGK